MTQLFAFGYPNFDDEPHHDDHQLLRANKSYQMIGLSFDSHIQWVVTRVVPRTNYGGEERIVGVHAPRRAQGVCGETRRRRS